MRVKKIVDEWFQDYKKPSMFIATCFCNWKCCVDGDFDKSICQNSAIADMPIIEVKNQEIIDRYKKNHITSAIVFGGLEPVIQFAEMRNLIADFRDSGIDDDIVIYTGYYPNEVINMLDTLKQYKNLIIKFGRYIPNKSKRYDDVLGVELASDNQYAVKFS